MVSTTPEQRHGLRLVLAIVAVLVVAAVALGAVLLSRGARDAAQADAVRPASESAAAASDATGGGTDQDAGTAEQDAAVGGADPAATDGDGSTEETVGSPAGVEPCPPAAEGLPDPTTTPYDEPPTVDLGELEELRASIATTCGTIVVELAASSAPATVGNFVALAEDGYYQGVGFHRVIDGFMVQGGDPTGTGTGCLDDACGQRLPGYTFPDELQLAEEVVAETGGYPRGTLAMANAGPDTNGSQFFIVQASPGYPLPPSYAVFGQVVEGLDVVDRIARGPVDGDLAVDPVVIRSIEVRR